MATKTILVSGATGATGGYTVSLLLERGHHVRALVHREDARSAALRERDVDVRVGDLLDLASVTDARPAQIVSPRPIKRLTASAPSPRTKSKLRAPQRPVTWAP